MNKNSINPGFGGVGPNTVPFHTHNGVDSPLLPSSTTVQKVYAGYVVAGGTKGNAFPPGWSVALSVATYTVTHNLGLTASGYSAIVTPVTSVTLFGHITAQAANTFSFRLTSTSGTNSTSDDASFILTTN